MIPENIIEDFRNKINESKKPLVFFHDDADGLCAFLQFIKFSTAKTKGVMLKTRPQLAKSYADIINDYNPDHVFVFDIALFEEELLEKINIPITWLDHHDILHTKKINYINQPEEEIYLRYILILFYFPPRFLFLSFIILCSFYFFRTISTLRVF